MAHLSISLFGSIKVTLAGQPVTHFRSDKVLALLVYLVVEAEEPHRRETLAGLLWPDQPEQTARHNLSQSLLRLRQAIGDKEASPPFLLATRQTIQFNPSSDYSLDVAVFLKQLEAKLASPNSGDEANVQALHQAAELYRGHFLEHFFLADSDLFEEWALSKRERLRQLALSALDRLIDYHEQQANYELTGHYARRQVELDSIREETHRCLMRLLALNGQRNAALAQYAACRRILAEELGIEPAAETVRLYEQIRSGEVSEGAEGQGSRKNISLLLPLTPTPLFDWGEAPDVLHFYGRKTELAQLQQWLVSDRCRLAAILGIGGQGKTALAAKAVKESKAQFDAVIWRSLLNAPPLAEILESWLRLLSRQQLATAPQGLDQQLSLLFEQVRRQRCLLILDNAESLMQRGQRASEYRPGYEPYGQLIRRFGESEHQSCLLLTSRERPREFTTLERQGAPVRSLQLTGLDLAAGQAILQEKGLTDGVDTTRTLINRYSGNPLALILVVDTVQELFDGDISAFLSNEAAIFEDIQDVLNQQFGRLTALEQAVMVWLAIEREPVSIQTLNDALAPPPVQSRLLEAVRSLQRRSLIEKPGDGWTLQNVVIEYVTDRLVRRVCQEVEQENPDWFNRHALIKAQAREYVRRSQVRLILKPVADWLAGSYGPAGVKARLARLLERVRSDNTLMPGYAGGNILNLLLHLNIDCRGWDFSGLTVWQAFLQGADLPQVNFAGADLARSAFTDTFSHVLSLTFSPDGLLLAARTGDEEVRLWQVANGQLHGVFSAPPNMVWPVVFSPNGRTLASGDVNTSIRLWDPQTGQVQQTLVGHTHRIWAMTFSPDGRFLASGSEDHTIRLWNVQTGQTVHILTGHTQAIWSVAFSPDGRRLASGSADRTIRLWDAQSGQLLQTLTGHKQRIWSVAFSPDGRLLASGGEDQIIYLWDMARSDLGTIEPASEPLEGHTRTIYSVAFSPDGRRLASGSADRTVILWDVQTGQAIHTLEGHTHEVRSTDFSPTHDILASGGWDQSIRLWDVGLGRTIRVLQGHRRGIRSVAYSPDGHSLACAGQSQRVHVWGLAGADTVDDQPLRHTLRAHTNVVFCVAFSPDGHTLASGGWDQAICLWDLRTGQLLNRLTWPTQAVLAIAFSPDGQLLASGSEDQTVPIWDLQTGQLRHTLRGHTKWSLGVAFSHDGAILASASEDQTVRLWDVKTGQAIHTLEGHTHGIWAVALSPDGRLLVSGGGDRVIRLWDVQTGQMLDVFEGHTNSIFCLAFSRDGRLLASGSEDQTIRLWDVQTRSIIHTLRDHTNAVWSVGFSRSGETLASGSADESIKFWAVDTGACLDTLQPPGPYDGMNIAGAKGLTLAQRTALKNLGVVEESSAAENDVR